MGHNFFDDTSILLSAGMGFSYDDEYDDDLSDTDGDDDFFADEDDYDDFDDEMLYDDDFDDDFNE